jgi:vesicle coat complex subunit
LNAKIKAERERDEVLIELEEYRSIAENIGAKKAVSEKEKAICERDAAIDAIMKIEEIFIDGDNTYEDWRSMGQIARKFLENTHESRINKNN